MIYTAALSPNIHHSTVTYSHTNLYL